jgi:hypothetical protein
LLDRLAIRQIVPFADIRPISTFDQGSELRLLVLAPSHLFTVDAQRQGRVCVAHFVHHRARVLAERI